MILNRIMKQAIKNIIDQQNAGIGKTITITAKSTDGTNKKASIKITIKK